MTVSSIILNVEVLLHNNQLHIYRQDTASPDFARSFAAHLAAFASLDVSERERILDNAPAVLSCEVKKGGSLGQLSSTASTDAKLPINFPQYGETHRPMMEPSFPINPRSLSSFWDSFPDDVDFTPWLNLDNDATSLPMEIDSQDNYQSESALNDNSRLLPYADNTPTTTGIVAEKDSKTSQVPTTLTLITGLKHGIEDVLENLRIKSVKDSQGESALSKAFRCILDETADCTEKCRKESGDSGDLIIEFFKVVSKKFNLLSSVLTSKTVKGPGTISMVRLCCELVLFKALSNTFLGLVPDKECLAPPAQELYHVSHEGVESFQPLPINGAQPWKCLRRVDSAPLDSWVLLRGDIANVDTGLDSGFAKVSDIRCLADQRYIVVYTWLYTREQIIHEMEIDGILTLRSQAHLDKMWPTGSRFKYMLSTNRTITLWDTALCRAAKEVSSTICYSAVYSTTPTSRRIWSIENPRFKWMKRILLLGP